MANPITHIVIDGTTYDIVANASLPEVTYQPDLGYTVNTVVRIQDGNTFVADGPASISGMIATSADVGIDITAPAFTCDCMITAPSFNATSDRRLKENIKDTELDYNYLLDNLHIVDFNFLNDENKNTNVGLIAQELREVLPEKYKDAIVVKNPITGY